MPTFAVIDRASKNVLGEFATRDEAATLLDELKAAAPAAEGDLALVESDETTMPEPSSGFRWPLRLHLTPEELSDKVGMPRDELIRFVIEQGIPIRQGKVDVRQFLRCYERSRLPESTRELT
jgi:hypothetical protein